LRGMVNRLEGASRGPSSVASDSFLFLDIFDLAPANAAFGTIEVAVAEVVVVVVVVVAGEGEGEGEGEGALVLMLMPSRQVEMPVRMGESWPPQRVALISTIDI
jgi:hypothetical protein